jgi:ribosomal protein L37AE/L43A
MSEIVNKGLPSLEIKKQIKVEISCPNCDNTIVLNANDVDIGHIIKCSKCNSKTYYPFEKPWYRKRKLIALYIISIVISFMIGLASNYVDQNYISVSDHLGGQQEQVKR